MKKYCFVIYTNQDKYLRQYYKLKKNLERKSFTDSFILYPIKINIGGEKDYRIKLKGLQEIINYCLQNKINDFIYFDLDIRINDSFFNLLNFVIKNVSKKDTKKMLNQAFLVYENIRPSAAFFVLNNDYYNNFLSKMDTFFSLNKEFYMTDEIFLKEYIEYNLCKNFKMKIKENFVSILDTK